MKHEKKRRRLRRRRMALAAGALLLLGMLVGGAALAVRRTQSPKPQTPPVPPASQAVQPEQPPANPLAARTDYSDVALVGNSQIDAFRIYEPLPGADCLYRVGLTVDTVFEKPMVGGDTPVIDLLGDKQYGYIFLLFGENELGWQYPEVFIERYGKVIDAVQARQPEAKVYIQSILPVSAAVSRKNEDNTNNARIAEYNTMLRGLAEDRDVGYLDVAAALQDETGALPDEAATDGVHLGSAYTRKWADLIAKQIEEDTEDET